MILPGCLLVLAFSLKLVIDREFNPSEFIKAGLDLPVDIAFLADSLVIGTILIKGVEVARCLTLLILFITASVFVIFFSRRADKWYFKEKLFLSAIAALASYAISLGALRFAIYTLLQLKK